MQPNYVPLEVYPNFGAGVNVGPEAFMYDSPTTSAVDDRWEITKGLARGIDELQAAGYGILGLTADTLKLKPIRDWAYQGAEEQLLEAQESPAAVANFTDIGGVKDAWKWLLGTIGSSIPSITSGFISGGVGALAGKKLVEKAVLKTIMNKVVSKAVAMKAGAYAGTFALGTGTEAGGNWLDDVEKHEIDNTNPLQDWVFGAIGGAVEAGLGVESRIARKLIKDATKETLKEIAEGATRKEFFKELGKGAFKGMGSESGEEGLQYISNILGTYHPSVDKSTGFDIKDMVNAAAAGAAGGLIPGMGEGVIDFSRRPRKIVSADNVEKDVTPEMPPTSEEVAQKGQQIVTKTVSSYQKKIADKEKTLQNLTNRQKQLLDLAMRPDLPEKDPTNPNLNAREHLEQEFFRTSAALVKVKEENKDFKSAAKNEVLKLQQKFERDAIRTNVEHPARQAEPKDMFDTVLDAQVRGEIKGRKAILEDHVNNELGKANHRIVQHEKLMPALEQSMNSLRDDLYLAQPTEDRTTKLEHLQQLYDWHQSEIDKENRFKDSLYKSFRTSVEDMAKRAVSGAKDNLYDPLVQEKVFNHYRSKASAANAIARMYTQVDQKRIAEAQKKGIDAKHAYYKNRREEMKKFGRLDLKKIAAALARKNKNLVDRTTISPDMLTQQQEHLLDFNRTSPLLIEGPTPVDIIYPGMQSWTRTEIPSKILVSDEQKKLIKKIDTLKNDLDSIKQKLNISLSEEMNADYETYNEMDKKEKAAFRKAKPEVVKVFKEYEKAKRSSKANKKLYETKISNLTEQQNKALAELEVVREKDTRPSTYQVNMVDRVNKNVPASEVNIPTEPMWEGREELKVDKKKKGVKEVFPRESTVGFIPDPLDVEWKRRENELQNRRDAKYYQRNAQEVALRQAVEKLVAERDIRKQQVLSIKNKAKHVMKIWNLLSDTLAKLPALADRVRIVDSMMLKYLPKDIQKAYAEGTPALFDQSEGKIYLFADNIQGKNNASMKRFALKQILHEGVGHFGLRIIMDSAQRQRFLQLVLSSFGQDKAFLALKEKYSNYSDLDLAEEFYTSVAMTIDINKVPDSTLKTKLKAFIRKVEVFLAKIFKDTFKSTLKRSDLIELAMYSAARLMNKNADAEYTPITGLNKKDKVRRVFASRAGQTWFENARATAKSLLTGITTSSIRDAKATGTLNKEASFYDKLVEGAGDSFRWYKALQEGILAAGGKIVDSVNVYNEEQTLGNKIAWATRNLALSYIGMNPDNASYKASENTIVSILNKLVGTAEGLTLEDILERAHEVLYAFHAPEANKVAHIRTQIHERTVKLADRVKKYRQMAERTSADVANKRLASKIEKIRQKSNLSSSESKRTAYHEEMKKLRDKMKKNEEILKGRKEDFMAKAEKLEATIKILEGSFLDLSGMTNERAIKIKAQYINASNEQLWAQLSGVMQEMANNNLSMLIEKKMLDPELADLWRETYSYYVPLRTVEDIISLTDPGYISYKRGRSLSLSDWVASKMRKGRKDEAGNVIINMIRKSEGIIYAYYKVDVNRALLNLIESNSNLDIIKDNFVVSRMRDVRALARLIKDELKEAAKFLNVDKVNDLKQLVVEYDNYIKKANEKISQHVQSYLDAKTPTRKNYYEGLIQEYREVVKMAALNREATKKKIEELRDITGYNKAKAALKDRQKELKKMQLENRRTRMVEDKATGRIKRVLAEEFQGQIERVVTLIDNDGNPVRVLIKHDGLAAAFKGLNIMPNHPALKVLSKTMSMLAKMYTTLNVEFLGRNPIRDGMTGLIHLQSAMQEYTDIKLDHNKIRAAGMKNYGPALKALYRAIQHNDFSGEWGPTVLAYMQSGAYTSMNEFRDFNKSMEALQDAINTQHKDPYILKKGAYATKQWVESASSVLENVTRLAAFKAIYDGYTAAGVSSGDSLKRAANISLNLTVNFSKRGTWSPLISSLYLFANANIQSIRRMTQAMMTLSNNPSMTDKALQKVFGKYSRLVKYFANITTASIILSALNRMIGGEDEDGIPYYDKIPEWTKASNFIIMFPGGNHLKCPLPYGYMVFYTIGQVIGDLAYGATTPGKALASTFSSIINNFSPLGDSSNFLLMITPTLGKPLAQILANRNQFDRPIRPEYPYQQGEIPDSQKKWSTTHPVAVQIAELLNTMSLGSKDRAGFIDISPTTLEHLVSQYTGGVGRVAMDTTQLAYAALTGDQGITVGDVPVIRTFGGSTSFYNTLHIYSKIRDEILTQNNEYKTAKDEGRITPEVSKQTQPGRMMKKSLDSLQGKLRSIAEKEKQIRATSADSEAIKNLDETKERLIKEFLKKSRRVGLK